MKKTSLIGIASVFAFSLGSAFADNSFKTLNGPGFYVASGYSYVATNNGGSNQHLTTQILTTTTDVLIRSFGLGAIGTDVSNGYPTGTIKIVSVKAPANVSVTLVKARTRAANDELSFYVYMAAGTPIGLNTLQIELENTLTGQRGTLPLTIEVR